MKRKYRSAVEAPDKEGIGNPRHAYARLIAYFSSAGSIASFGLCHLKFGDFNVVLVTGSS